MKPVVVLVGRPNVGKSTLFNALTRTQNALVADAPGVTRDRQYGDGRFRGQGYLVVDTGGLTADADVLAGLAMRQTRQAIAEADAVVLVVDGRDGLMPGDLEIAQELRRQSGGVTLAVNKTEGSDADVAVAEFHALGLGPPIAISAAHQRGLDALREAVLGRFSQMSDAEERDTQVARVAIVGRPNVGKSTLANTLLGEDRLVVSDIAGTTRDSVEVALERAGRTYHFIDTAGVRRRAKVTEAVERFSVVQTLRAIDRAHVVILLLDAVSGVTDQDASIAGMILNEGRGVVMVVNKWDAVGESERLHIKREIDRKLSFLDFAKPLFVSALKAQRLEGLLPALDRAYASARADLSSSRLNRVLREAMQALPPPIGRGRRIRLKYAHQGGRNPPLIIIHGTQTDAVPDAYRRYLAHRFRAAFRLEGTPVRVEFRSGINPFASDADS